MISLMTQFILLITLRGASLWGSIVFFIPVTRLRVVVNLVTRSSSSLVKDLASVIIPILMVILGPTILKGVVWWLIDAAAGLHVSYINSCLWLILLYL